MVTHPITTTEEANAAAEALHRAYGDFKGYPHSSEMYSNSKWIKRSLKLPEWVSLRSMEVPHSVYLRCQGIKNNIKHNQAPYLLYNTEQLDYVRSQNKFGHIVGSPFVHCRKLLGIEKNKDAKGTLFFPTHSTLFTEVRQSHEHYALDLLNLPKTYQPVSVCLYFKELMAGHALPYIEKGIPVYSAGHMLDPDNAENFYRILQRFAYTSSSQLGSYTWYSIEMGIPFFLHGEEPTFIEHGGPDYIKAMKVLDPETEEYQLLDFEDFKPFITFDLEKGVHIVPEFKAYTEELLGLNEQIDHKAVRAYIYRRHFRSLIGRLVPKFLKKKLVGK